MPSYEAEAEGQAAPKRAGDARLRAILDGTRIGTWEMDLADGRLSLSETSARLLGSPEHAPASWTDHLALVQR
jgi:hypothetical protein